MNTPGGRIGEFLDYVVVEKGLSLNTRDSYGRDLANFEVWLGKKGLQLEAASSSDISRYLKSLSRPLVCLVRYVVPGLQAITGLPPRQPEPVALGAPFRVKPALWYFLPVQLDSSPKLGTVALPRPTRGSGDFILLLATEGFVELPPGPADFPAGYVAPLYRW